MQALSVTPVYRIPAFSITDASHHFREQIMRINRHLFSLILLLGLSGGANPLTAAEPAGLSVSVSISPAATGADDCLCKAEMTDLADGKLVAAPNVVLRKGESGRVSIGDQATYTLVFELSVDKSGTSAVYAVTYAKKGTVVSVQKGAISIR